jgi:hypothetical protein
VCEKRGKVIDRRVTREAEKADAQANDRQRNPKKGQACNRWDTHSTNGQRDSAIDCVSRVVWRATQGRRCDGTGALIYSWSGEL